MNIRSSKTAKADLVAAEASAWFIEFRTEDMTQETALGLMNGSGVLPSTYRLTSRSPRGGLSYRHPIRSGGSTSRYSWRGRETAAMKMYLLSPREMVLPKGKLPSIRAWAASLAGVALVVGLAVWSHLYHADTYRTGVGEQRTVRLLGRLDH